MRYVNFYSLIVVCILLALPIKHYRLSEAVPLTKIEFVSDPTWNTYLSDPAMGATIPSRTAQKVCLNAFAPVSCPIGATLYEYSYFGWSADLNSIPGATWIWAPDVISSTSPADLQQYYFAKTINLPEPPIAGNLSIAVDDFAEIHVNGSIVGTIGNITDVNIATNAQSQLTTFDLTQYLVTGDNLIVIRAQNGPNYFANCPASCNYSQNPAAVVFGGSLLYESPTSLDESTEPLRFFLPILAR